jgi:ankyrin repeat protein
MLGADIHIRNDQAFILACSNGHLKIAKWLHMLGADIHIRNDHAFILACYGGHLKIAKWLHNDSNINIGRINDAFIYSCKNGHFEITKWLHSLGANINITDANTNIAVFALACYYNHIKIAKWLYSLGVNIHANNEDAFIQSCSKGCLQIAKWLYSLKVDIHVENDMAFRKSCNEKQMKIVEWLCTIEPNYTYVIENNEMKYKVNNGLDELYQSKQYELFLAKLKISKNKSAIGDLCMICYDTHQYMTITTCNHVMCIDCMYVYRYAHGEYLCPYCRRKLNISGYWNKCEYAIV